MKRRTRPAANAPPLATPRPLPAREEPTPHLTDAEALAIGSLLRTPTPQKARRGLPLTVSDAATFWGVAGGRSALLEGIQRTEELLQRACRLPEGDARLPPLKLRFELLQLHRLLRDRFGSGVENRTQGC